ncbi:HNH endonuclease [Hafnia paralvei]
MRKLRVRHYPYHQQWRRMQLVPAYKHSTTGHIGGKSMSEGR